MIVSEPKGESYDALVKFALSLGGTFSLVTRRKPLGANADHDDVLERLRPFLIEEKKVKSWPGGRSGRGLATLRRYRCDRAARAVLVEAVVGLYGWVQPSRPEDLAFYDTRGRCWLETTTHEGEAYVHDDLVAGTSLQRAVPQLALRRHPGAG
jgi:hypothetical protein